MSYNNRPLLTNLKTSNGQTDRRIIRYNFFCRFFCLIKENMKDEKLEKTKKSNWGGKRKGSGRKPLMNKEHLEYVKSLVSQHGSEIDPVKNKERVLVMLECLYKAGLKGNIPAMKEYFDRNMGKASQTIIGDKENPLVNVVNNYIEGGDKIAEKYEEELKKKLGK